MKNCDKNFTVLLVSYHEIEKFLSEASAEADRWQITPGYCCHFVGVEETENENSSDLYDSVSRKFGKELVRRGTVDFPRHVTDLLRGKGLRLAAAESCTGGLISKLLTDAAGSSDVFWGGFITYSNEAKMQLLKVKERTLAEFGAVSEETVREMASGALEASGAGIVVAVSGIAGPGGGTALKPVGTIWIGVQMRGKTCKTLNLKLSGPRKRIRMYSAFAVLLFVEALIGGIERIDTKTLNEYI